MNWDRVEGAWKQRRGKAVHHWGKTMNDELAAIAGKHEQIVGILQEKYGIATEKAKQQANLFKVQCTACRLRTAELTENYNGKLREMQKALDKQKKAYGKPVKLKTSVRKKTRPKANGTYKA